MGNILKIGHRGAKGLIAENTLESIVVALQHGVDAIEIDVHRCKSGELVVIHDFTLDRTTNGSGEVNKKNIKELKTLLVEGKYTIPLLTEVLDVIKDKCSINIELKGTNTAAATCIVIQEQIKTNGWKYEDFIVSSFQKKELSEVYKRDTKIPIGILSKANVADAIEIGKQLNVKAIHPSIGIISRDNVLLSQKAGFKVNVWTVNDPVAIGRMKDFGVDGIITDYPDRF